MVPLTGFEPVRPKRAGDFKSPVSTIPPQRLETLLGVYTLLYVSAQLDG